MYIHNYVYKSGVTIGDGIFLFFYFVIAFLFFYDSNFWAGSVNIGSMQYGDAAFWWSGALQFSEGILKDNANITFRMGYAIFAGIFTAIFGPDYFLFHKFLIAIFLGSLAIFYFAIKPFLGRVLASFALVFFINPYLAERLALSTSDSVGLIFSILSLSFLIFGFKNNLTIRDIFISGIFLSLASLTRPLMSPFILAAIVIICIYKTSAIKGRFLSVGAIILGYFIPTLAWVFVLHQVTGVWGLAGHDSSALYAASDPNIQVWSGEMYQKIEALAKARYATNSPNPSQMSNQFWVEALNNYQTHFSYHFKRIFFNIYEVAKFAPILSIGTIDFSLLRKLCLSLVGLYLMLQSIYFSRILASLALATFTLFLIKSGNVGYPFFVIAGASLPLLIYAIKGVGNIALAVIASYWWIGVGALYITGGIWGPPIGQNFDMNALGYRIGSQFFFCNDILVVGLLSSISQLSFFSKNKKHSLAMWSRIAGGVLARFQIFWCRDISTLFRRICIGVGFIFFSYCTIGLGIIGYKGYIRGHISPIGYPPYAILDINKLISVQLDSGVIAANTWSEVYEAIGTNGEGGKASPFIAFTGTLSNFIWNLKGQERSQAIIYFQKNRVPFEMSQNEIYVEFPDHLNESRWKNAAGIWVIRRLKDSKPKSNLPYCYSEAAVKAFVPYSSLDNNYDFEKAVVFPLKKYASQLHLSGDLSVKTGMVSWEFSSAGLRFPRMFTISNNGDEKKILDYEYSISLLKAIKPYELALCSCLEVGKSGSVKITGIKSSARRGDADELLYQGKFKTDCSPQNYIHIDLRNRDLKTVKIEYLNLEKGAKVNVYELNITADDFSQNNLFR